MAERAKSDEASGRAKSADEARRIAGEKFALSFMEEWASTGVDPDQGPDGEGG